MQVIHKSKEEGGTIFFTDGYFNLAIIPNKEQNSPNGLYHFGFQVENGEAIVEKMKKINPKNCPSGAPMDGPYAETRGWIRWQLFRYLGAWFSGCSTGWRAKAELNNSVKNLRGSKLRPDHPGRSFSCSRFNVTATRCRSGWPHRHGPTWPAASLAKA